jgi:hypothetical protein
VGLKHGLRGDCVPNDIGRKSRKLGDLKPKALTCRAGLNLVKKDELIVVLNGGDMKVHNLRPFTGQGGQFKIVGCKKTEAGVCFG